jgi:hypothetical protein
MTPTTAIGKIDTVDRTRSRVVEGKVRLALDVDDSSLREGFTIGDVIEVRKVRTNEAIGADLRRIVNATNRDEVNSLAEAIDDWDTDLADLIREVGGLR